MKRKLKEKQVQDDLVAFSRDAREVYIFAGDASFLDRNGPQWKEISRDGEKYRMLLRRDGANNLSALKELVDRGLQVRTYPKDRPNPGLRGRLKVTNGADAALLYDKKNDRYRVIDLDNKFIVEMLRREHNQLYENGGNPFVKHIIFDLAGVFFDGDFRNFMAAVCQATDRNIAPPLDEDVYLCVNRDLNLPGGDILTYLMSHGLSQHDVDNHGQHIRQLWGSVWTVNHGMAMLVSELRDHGMTVSIASNCDPPNGTRYMTHGFLDHFDHRFMSYEMNLLKPSEAYYKCVLDRLGCTQHPFTCLYFDDHPENVRVARALGFSAVHVRRDVQPNQRAEFIREHLIAMAVLPRGTKP